MDSSALARALPLLDVQLAFDDELGKPTASQLAHNAVPLIKENLRDQRLGDLVPALVGNTDGIEDLDATVRVYNALRRGGVFNLSQLAMISTQDFADLPQVGDGSINDLLSKLLRWALDNVELALREPPAGQALAQGDEARATWTPSRDSQLAHATRVALSWTSPPDNDDGTSSEPSAFSMSHFQRLLQEESRLPTVVREAFELLAAEVDAQKPDLRAVASAWWVTLDERLQEVIRQRTGPSQETLQCIGDKYGVGRERIRQLERDGLAELRAYCNGAPGYLLARQARALRRFTPAVPRGLVFDTWPELSWPVADGTDMTLLDMVVACDAEASWSEEWICWRPLDQLWKELQAALIDAKRGPALHPEDARRVLAGTGLDHLTLDDVLPRLGWWSADEIFFEADASLQDQAFVRLDAANEPMTDDQLQSQLWRPGALSSLRNQLATDRRFVRTGPGEWGLAVWGLDEYDGILAELEKAVRQAGGRIRTEEVIADLVSRFGVAASSVRAYAARDTFVRRDGYLSLNQAPTPPKLKEARPASTRRMFRDTSGTWWLRIDVTENILAGFSPAITVGAAVSLGVQPGETKTFEVRDTQVTINFSRPQPSMGSVGKLAKSVRAKVGDHLFFAPGRDAGELRHRRVGHPSSNDVSLVLAALTATIPGTDLAESLTNLTHALAVDVRMTAGDLREHLERRGDDDLAALLGAYAHDERPAAKRSSGEQTSAPDDFLAAMGWDT